MNTVFYEFRPWVFAAMGLLAMYNSSESAMMYGSSILLIFTSVLILQARMAYRNKNRRR